MGVPMGYVQYFTRFETWGRSSKVVATGHKCVLKYI